MGPPSLAGEQLLGNYYAALVIGNGAFSGVRSRNQALHGQRPSNILDVAEMLVGAYARCVWLALPASAVYLFRESREREAESMWRTQTEECVGSPEERRVELDNRTGDCARARRVGVRTRCT